MREDLFLADKSVLKKRRYADLYGYTLEEFDRWLERGINKKLRSAGKCRSELDMPAVFAAYEDETRELPRRRLREMRTAAWPSASTDLEFKLSKAEP